MTDSLVKNRAIFMIGGYEPKTAGAFYKRTKRDHVRFGNTWQLETDIEPLKFDEDNPVATAHLETGTADWTVNTEFNFIMWNKLVLDDFARPLPVRLWRYIISFLDYVFSGTMFSFFRTNWRFALYFLYPAVFTLIFALVSCFAAGFVLRFDFPGSFAISIIVAIIVFTVLFLTLGKRWNILHLFDLWSFSRYFLHDKRPDAQALAEIHARMIVDCAGSKEFDEILLVGHSTGGAMILSIAAAALALDPQFADGKSRVSILTVGSTALKVGMHPAAKAFRRKVQKLVDCPNLGWVEYQSLTDIINFYKVDPVKEMKLNNARKEEFPVIRQVRIKHMLEPELYARARRNFFRMHYRFILANTRPYFYDFYAICCAPLFLKDRTGLKQMIPRNPDEIKQMLIGERS